MDIGQPSPISVCIPERGSCELGAAVPEALPVARAAQLQRVPAGTELHATGAGRRVLQPVPALVHGLQLLAEGRVELRVLVPVDLTRCRGLHLGPGRRG